MLSPLMTVFVLAVLWLIVVVPMVVRRNDERRRDRSLAGFGRAMRALGRRATTDAHVFVPAEAWRKSLAEPAEAPGAGKLAPSVATRRPVPAAQEALMYPVDRSEMSAAREAMMRRRRRSLAVLGGGSVFFLPFAAIVGGLVWLPAVLFLGGLGGYVWFLRTQARRDQDRRSNRASRAYETRSAGYDATAEEPPAFVAAPENVVRIDDDDIELHSMDTIDLTGIYSEDSTAQTASRRAS